MRLNLFFVAFILIKADSCFSKKNGHEISKLIESILKDYDKHQSPGNGTIPVNIYVQVSSFEMANEDSFRLGGYFVMRWADKRITWDPTKYFNKTVLLFDKNDIWLPVPAVVYSEASLLQIRNIDTFLGDHARCTSKGIIYLFVHFIIHMKNGCNSNFKNWPHDMKSCKLSIGFSSSMDQNITMLTLYKNLYVSFNFVLNNQEWGVIKKSGFKLGANESEHNMDELVILMDVVRNGSLYGSIYFQPCLVILGIALTLFWMDVWRPERIVLIGLLLTVQCAIFTSMMYLVPNHGNQTPFVMSVYSLTFFLVITLFLVTTLSRKMLSTAYNPIWLQSLSALSVGNSIISYSLFLNVNPRTAAELIEEDEEGSLLVMKTKKLQKQWQIVTQMLNSLTFILFIPISGYLTVVYYMYM